MKPRYHSLFFSLICLVVFLPFQNCTELSSDHEGNNINNVVSSEEETDSDTQEESDDEPTIITDPGETVGHCLEYDNTYNPQDFDHVLENFDQTTTLRLEGSQWDNTLVQNCKIHDTGDDGIFLRDVKNVVITHCEIYNIQGHSGIRTSISGVTHNITIDRNYIHNLDNNGINLPQRASEGVSSINARVTNNRIADSGLKSSNGLTHHIYSQSEEIIISGNSLSGQRDGNGISHRSSGQISCNKISGTSLAGKPGIRYYSDHSTGVSKTLSILKNYVQDQAVGINIFKPVQSYDGDTSLDHVVKNFVIQNNILTGNTVGISIDSQYQSAPFTLQSQ